MKEKTQDDKAEFANRLAVERTILANERTLLAYVRTSLTFVIAGAGFIRFLDIPSMRTLGWGFIVASVVIMLLGVYRYKKTKKLHDMVLDQ
jgi:putative membrane protein